MGRIFENAPAKGGIFVDRDFAASAAMREVIQKVLQAEDEAKCLLQEAQAEAARILAEAEKQARDLVVRRRQEVRVEAEKIMAAAIQEAEREKRESLTRAAAEIEAQVRFDEVTKQHAVEAVVRFVCGY